MVPYKIMFTLSYFKNHCLYNLDLLKSLILNFDNIHNVVNVVAVRIRRIPNKSSALAVALTGINALIFLIHDQERSLVCPYLLNT